MRGATALLKLLRSGVSPAGPAGAQLCSVSVRALSSVASQGKAPDAGTGSFASTGSHMPLLSWAAGAAAGAAMLTATAGSVSADASSQAPSTPCCFELPPLPYAPDALEPHMSANTLNYHWGKHHRTYVDNLNKQIASGVVAAAPGASLQEVVLASWNGGKPTPAFNNAAQALNHEFFWCCMAPGAGLKGAPPTGALGEALVRDFGSLEAFGTAFQQAGLTQFGSGWAWLVCDGEGNLKILKTGNAVTPVVSGWTPLLVCDVWEHAYYLDFHNRRGDFLSAFLDHLADWRGAEARYAAAVLA